MNVALWLVGATLSCLLCGAVALAEPSVTNAAVGTEAALIDLNRASAAELTRLPGIGEKRAEAILAFRESHGGFRSVTELLKIKGIGRAMLRKLRSLVTVSAEAGIPSEAALASASKPEASRSSQTPPPRTGSVDIHRVR